MSEFAPLLPHVNAALNAAATVLLVAGLVLIKQRRVAIDRPSRLRLEAAHQWTMLACFAVSVLFLASYLTHHWYLKYVVKLPYGSQILWPDHCVQGTDGAAIHKGIDIPHAQLVIRKGHNPKVDSYSAFIEADGKLKTGLDGYL